ncbi:MAG TPA: preprotein translocase subunit SecG [Planctomycetota bacterium]|nr:preprotein translocase subunit SecG [Planctomycetota bacterium]
MLDLTFLAWTWTDVTWYLISAVLFFVICLMIGLILIQDSKDTGLTSAFGGGSSTALLGAKMQKELARFTAILGIVMAICLFSMGLITSKSTVQSVGATGAVLPPPNLPDTGVGATGQNPFGGIGATPPGTSSSPIDGSHSLSIPLGTDAPAAAPGATPGATPGSNPATAPTATPRTNPGSTAPSTAPGATSGAAPAAQGAAGAASSPAGAAPNAGTSGASGTTPGAGAGTPPAPGSATSAGGVGSPPAPGSK